MKHPTCHTLTLLLLTCLGLAPSGCKREQAAQPIAIMLDWKPEPEFGGFYQADLSGLYKSHGLDVVLKSAGAGAPTWQLVASKQTEFATTAADQVLIARSRGADVVAIFAVFQTSPQGIMVHAARGFSSIRDVFTHPGTLAAEDDTWLKYLLGRFPNPTVSVVGYSSGIATFLAKPDYSQQCFVTSEPLLAKRNNGDPKTFLIAEAGYNPYTTVLITSGQTIREHPDRGKAMVQACREGWQRYLDDPAAANLAMGKLNTEMDADTFREAADAQRPLIQPPGAALGSMTAERWNRLSQQLFLLKVIDKALPPEECFVNADALPGKK
jgi:NitT/TauT family transport system substrate-binding protein